MAKLSDKQQKARTLFLTGEYSQKEIAEICKASEKTIGIWKKEGRWDELSLSLVSSRENELKNLYLILRNLNEKTLEDIENGLRVNPKDGDAAIKYSAAIKNLELETSIADKVEVGMALIGFIRKENIEDAKVVTKWFDVFLKACIK